MNKEEALEQIYRLKLDWEDEGLNTKLNQTDINAIGIIVSELDIANKKLNKIKEYIKENACYDKKTKECKLQGIQTMTPEELNKMRSLEERNDTLDKSKRKEKK